MKTQAQTLRFAPALPAFVQDVILSISAALAARRTRHEREAAIAALYANPGFIAEFGHALPGMQEQARDLAQFTPAVLAASLPSMQRDGGR